MVKISNLPPDSAPTLTDMVPSVDTETSQTKQFLLSALATLLFTQTNIPAGGGSPVTREDEGHLDYVASGLVITADSAGVNRNWSMTAGTIYINGRRISISALTAQTATASKDTYADILDNQDGTGTVVTTGGNIVANNAASPALAANSVRIGIIVAGATTIVAAASINQGQEDRVLPIASSIAYSVTDSLGNLICPRDPNRKLLGFRQITANIGSLASTTAAQITGLSCPVIVPAGRRAIVTVHTPAAVPNANAAYGLFAFDGTIGGGGTQLSSASVFLTNSQASGTSIPGVSVTPTSTSKTYNAGYSISTGNITLGASSIGPAFIKVELA